MKILIHLMLFCSVGVSWAGGSSVIQSALDSVVLAEPTKRAPLSMNAVLLNKSAKVGDSVTVAIKAKLMKGWHTYAYDPTHTFKVTNHELELPASLELDGDWDLPGAEPYSAAPNILIYHDDLLFQQKVKVKEGTAPGDYTITVTFDYQVCDPYICLPPKREKKQLVLTVK